jgi:hypothetical protein
VDGLEGVPSPGLELPCGVDQKRGVPAPEVAFVEARESVGLAEADLLHPSPVGDRRLEGQLVVGEVGEVAVHQLGHLDDRARRGGVVSDDDRAVQRLERGPLKEQSLREGREAELPRLQDDRAHRPTLRSLRFEHLPQSELGRSEHERHELLPVEDLQGLARVEGIVLTQPTAQLSDLAC